MTTVINLIAPPGTGKSTIASQLFAMMKWEGISVELVSEYAKDLVWEQRQHTLMNQSYVFGKQHHRLWRLIDKVDYIITDSPLVLSQFYNSHYGDNSTYFRDYVLYEMGKFNNKNILLKRTKPYVEAGRNQTAEESDAFYPLLQEMLEEYKLDYFPILATTSTAQVILELIRNNKK